MTDDKYLISAKASCAEERIEIARSFSMKRNLGNYESADFFSSAKKSCFASDAERESDLLYQFCKSEVLKSIRAFEQSRNSAQKERVA